MMIGIEEYQLRRTKLCQRLPEGSVALLAGARLQIRNGDAHYRFRQASDFYYLTGFEEPDAILILFAGATGESILFNNPRDPAIELWTGKRLGQEGACRDLGMQAAYPVEEFQDRLPDLLANKSGVYYALEQENPLQEPIFEALQSLKKRIRQGIKAPDTLSAIEPLLSEMRLIKSKAEIAVIRRAAEISVIAHRKAMRACPKLQHEYELEAELAYEFMRLGCRGLAYDTIVGAGAHACILHYTNNDGPFKPGEMVLVDAGGEYQNYASDITRTYPVNGRFSKPGRTIYELVLKAQKAGIACIKPGALWSSIQGTMVNVLTSGLCELGILSGKLEDLITAEAYKPFYKHNSGHWLGLDVHDVGRYKLDNEWRPLEPGMVLTVEPGLYISEGMTGVDPKWWNIGVRIEDDILVTETGHENLTKDLPVEVAEIEALMHG